jgi:hypothetical protein
VTVHIHIKSLVVSDATLRYCRRLEAAMVVLHKVGGGAVVNLDHPNKQSVTVCPRQRSVTRLHIPTGFWLEG